MKRLQFKDDGSGNFKIREFAVMRDGTIVLKVSDSQGSIMWISADALEVVYYD